MLLTPGLGRGPVGRNRAAQRIVGRGHPRPGRGGALAPSQPPSRTVPLFFHVRSATISPERLEHESIIYYKIIVTGIGDSSWFVFRRYSDFAELFEKIASTNLIIKPQFPSRHWFSFITGFTEEELRERHKQLEMWFADVIINICGEERPAGVSTYDINVVKDHLNVFLDVEINFATALRNTEDVSQEKAETNTESISTPGDCT